MRIHRAALLALLLAAPAAAEPVNRIVLRVNDTIATLDDYIERRNARIEAITRAPELTDDQRRELIAQAGKQTMREIFEELVVLSRAQQLHIQASPAEIDRAVDQSRRRFGIADDQQFAEALAQSGMTLDEFRQRMSRNILYDEVVQREVRPKVKVDDEMVAREYHAHPELFGTPERRQVEEAIVRTAEPQPSSTERELAVRIRDALTAGKRIADVVKELGVEDKVIVLDHDWVERGALDGPLDTALWELDAGGVAGPLEARGGLHILHLLAIQPVGTKPLEEVRDQIRGRLQAEQFDRASQQMLDDLVSTAYIVEHLPPEAVGYRETKINDDDPVRKLLRGPATAEQPVPAAADGVVGEGDEPASAPPAPPSAPPPAAQK